MSSRKRKKKSRADEATESAASEASSAELESSEDEPAAEPADEPDESAGEEDPEPQPAVSEISELKPRRKRKRAKEEEPEPDPAAVETAEVEASETQDDEDEEEEDEVADTAKEAPKSRAQLKRVIESLIFVSDQVITAQQLGRITKTKVAEVRDVLGELTSDYETRGIDLIEVNGGYQFRSSAASAPYVRVLVAQKPVRLTRAQLETLALIAYRQPITRPEVDDVRGVDSGSAIKVLLDRDLIKILGRKDDAGRPLLYGTTPFFLEFFGMNTMQELPTLREFTELSDEHRELFKAKTNDIGDPSAEAEFRISTESDAEPESEGASEAEPETPESEPPADAERVALDSEIDATDVAIDGAVDSDASSVDHGGAQVQGAVDDQVDEDAVPEALDESIIEPQELDEPEDPDPALSSEPEPEPEPEPDEHT